MSISKTVAPSICLFVLVLLGSGSCQRDRIDLETEALILHCEDQRDATELIALASGLDSGNRLTASRLAIAAGRIGDFALWKTLGKRFAKDPVVTDMLAVASLFPATGFPGTQTLDVLMKLPYTPLLCQAILGQASPEALNFVLEKELYPETVAENLWRCGKLVPDDRLKDYYRRAPRHTTYSLARLRRKGIVKGKDLMGAPPFIRSVGVSVCDDPIPFLGDPDWRVRVNALRRIEQSSEILQTLMMDENPLVRAEAYAATARTKGDLSEGELERMSPMQARWFLENQTKSPTVEKIFIKGGDFALLAAPYLPMEYRDQIMASELPLQVKLSFLIKHSREEALLLAMNRFREARSTEALQFLLENEKKENLSPIIAEARNDTAFVSVMIDNDLIKLPIPFRDREWYRKTLQKIRQYKGFTLFTDSGEVDCLFQHESAPLTVFNFITLTERGYYDGTRFHRVVPAFVCQGGDPTGSGSGGPGYAIRCEYNALHYDVAGVVGMALSGKDTGGSQFFLTHLPTPHLDYNYSIFAKSVRGFSTLERTPQYQSLKTIQLW